MSCLYNYKIILILLHTLVSRLFQLTILTCLILRFIKGEHNAVLSCLPIFILLNDLMNEFLKRKFITLINLRN